jgi:hypothetical protein
VEERRFTAAISAEEKGFSPGKKIALLLSRYPDPLFHLIQIFGQSLATGCGQPIFRSRHSSLKELHARNVLCLFQLPRMDA